MSDDKPDFRPRCSYCRKLVPTVDQRADGVADDGTCLCDDKWLGQTPPQVPPAPKPVKG